MVLNFTKTLKEALEKIEFEDEYQQLAVHEREEQANPQELIDRYGNAKWAIVESLNERYDANFDLHNWVRYNDWDEVAYFLNETGSNALNHSEFKAPSHFHLWMGVRGFIIGVEQKGKGFDAQKVYQEEIRENEGAAFTFFKDCKSTVFFDQSKDARIVYLNFLFE